MIATVLLALLAADLPAPVWHHEVQGVWQEKKIEGMETRDLTAAQRKEMEAAVAVWGDVFKRAFQPAGMNIYLGRGISEGSRYKDAPYFMEVAVMFFRLMSWPRTPNKIEADDETGRTIRAEINSTSILDQSVWRLGKSAKGSPIFLEPQLLPSRQGFMEYALDSTSRALVLLPSRIQLFTAITNEELYGLMQPQVFGLDRERLEADFAALGAAARRAPATALPQSGWAGFFPAGGRRVVRYNGYVFRTRTTRTAPHFATVWWKCTRGMLEDLPWMERQIERVDWKAFPLAP
jgi:hypothetical protein